MDGFDNLFDEALFDADSRIIEVMGREMEVFINGAPTPIRAVFDEPAADTSLPQGAATVQDVAPRLFVKTARVAGLKHKDLVQIGAESFWVVKVGPDDTGSCVVTLARGEPGRASPAINKWSK
ncbi:head-tail joining protein [Serratia ficaria]|uniref:head-tail joining protein n=1 Tax=Serratia ficaria TaxID=61651 RepID=UPI0021C5EC60|nr:head-tail joining protein [Serratia ficaria]